MSGVVDRTQVDGDGFRPLDDILVSRGAPVAATRFSKPLLHADLAGFA